MKKKEWLHYFEIINGRKPSTHDINEAIEKKEFQPNMLDIGLRLIREKIPNKKIRVVISLLLLSVIVGVLFFPFFRLTYYNVMSGVFDEKYQSVVEEYQKSIDNEDDGKEYKKILEQPSRVPSYSQIDSNNDGKKELYITRGAS